MMTLWKRIFESSQKELFALERELMVIAGDLQTRAQLFYIQIMIAYHRQDAKTMARLIAKENFVQFEFVQKISRIRLALRSEKLDVIEVRAFSEMTDSNSEPSLFKAEAYFVIGACYMALKLYIDAETSFKKSAIYFDQGSSIKKSLRSSLSAIASYSCAYPESRLFYEYTEIYHQCLQAEEFLSAATALLNISREFQILGADGVALNYSIRAIELLEKKDRGSREHGLALVHQAQLYFDQKQKDKAQSSLIFALSIGNKDVQSACQILADKHQLNLKALPSESILPTWSERLDEAEKLVLSPLESQLIQLLSECPKDKFELMDALYGDLISLESKEGRFKNVLARLRVRYPDLIRLSDQKYYLSEASKNVG